MGNGIGMAASGPRTLDIRSSLDWQRRLVLRVPLVWQCADKTVTVFVVSALGRFLK